MTGVCMLCLEYLFMICAWIGGWEADLGDSLQVNGTSGNLEGI